MSNATKIFILLFVLNVSTMGFAAGMLVTHPVVNMVR